MTGNMLRTLLPSIVFAVVTTISLHGQGPPVPAPHVRIADAELRRLFDAGVVASPTLCALVRRLDDSDVIAYLRFEAPRGAIEGSLQFVGASAGVRYVLIRVARQPTRRRQLALIAHELQHAIEVAAAPHIVDLQTFVQEYERIGHVSRHPQQPTRSFETLAARATGQRVLEELKGRDLRGRQPPAELASLTMAAPAAAPAD